MPDLDTGHIFLTTLAPIKAGAPKDSPQNSYEQRVRIALAKLPTAHQSPATENFEYNSPFARNTRNHLARMFVLDDVVYNGRNTMNPLLARFRRVNQMISDPVDRLNAPYLVFCAEVDAITQEGDPLPTTLTEPQQREVRAGYARKLWETMQEELICIYSNCYGFETVQTADDFANYLDRCHVETTMPFHDYYLSLDQAGFHHLPLKGLLYGVLAPLGLGALVLVLWLFGLSHLPLIGWSTLATGLGAILLGVILAVLAIRYAIKNGEKPLAPAKYDDLPSVLKALYIQQNFSDFFIENQGVSDTDLYAAFGQFIQAHKPQDRTSMTQKPGVISSASPSNVTQ
ncbi:hypothetical protein [Donghicola mangrovi]|uniref:Uncharacterized protein n=1 Tax=Donghicola mangrovi TaxID=2729614 RepID=A0A850QFZ0_9RHOB|nr:hypothetical protein [Donghicola mangrovi]NVO24771.1 hypothetical protein [Donghicola mangrovi]